MVKPTVMYTSFEGYDNAGKTTIIGHVKQRLQDRYKKESDDVDIVVLSTADTESGKTIRQHYKNKTEIDPQEEIRLHMQSIDELNLLTTKYEKDTIVIIDRFIDSLVAYQLNGDISTIRNWFIKYRDILHITYYIDLHFQDYLKGLKIKTNKIEHPEERNHEHFKRVTDAYKRCFNLTSEESADYRYDGIGSLTGEQKARSKEICDNRTIYLSHSNHKEFEKQKEIDGYILSVCWYEQIKNIDKFDELSKYEQGKIRHKYIEDYEKSKQGNWENSWQSCAYYSSELPAENYYQEFAKLRKSKLESKQK